MRIGITSKMVLVILATSILLVGAMAVAMRWSFQKGFIDYLTEAELGRLDQTVEDLANAYRREGSWEFMRNRHHVWASFMPLNEQGQPLMPRGAPRPANTLYPNDRPSIQQRFDGQAPPLGPRDRSGLTARLRLLDAQKQYLIGPPDTSGKVVLRPIELDSDVVGWLSLTP